MAPFSLFTLQSPAATDPALADTIARQYQTLTGLSLQIEIQTEDDLLSWDIRLPAHGFRAFMWAESTEGIVKISGNIRETRRSTYLQTAFFFALSEAGLRDADDGTSGQGYLVSESYRRNGVFRKWHELSFWEKNHVWIIRVVVGPFLLVGSGIVHLIGGLFMGLILPLIYFNKRFRVYFPISLLKQVRYPDLTSPIPMEALDTARLAAIFEQLTGYLPDIQVSGSAEISAGRAHRYHLKNLPFPTPDLMLRNKENGSACLTTYMALYHTLQPPYGHTALYLALQQELQGGPVVIPRVQIPAPFQKDGRFLRFRELTWPRKSVRHIDYFLRLLLYISLFLLCLPVLVLLSGYEWVGKRQKKR